MKLIDLLQFLQLNRFTEMRRNKPVIFVNLLGLNVAINFQYKLCKIIRSENYPNYPAGFSKFEDSPGSVSDSQLTIYN